MKPNCLTHSRHWQETQWRDLSAIQTDLAAPAGFASRTTSPTTSKVGDGSRGDLGQVSTVVDMNCSSAELACEMMAQAVWPGSPARRSCCAVRR